MTDSSFKCKNYSSARKVLNMLYGRYSVISPSLHPVVEKILKVYFEDLQADTDGLHTIVNTKEKFINEFKDICDNARLTLEEIYDYIVEEIKDVDKCFEIDYETGKITKLKPIDHFTDEQIKRSKTFTFFRLNSFRVETEATLRAHKSNEAANYALHDLQCFWFNLDKALLHFKDLY